MKAKIMAALAVVTLFATGCSEVSTDGDEIALHYSGGAFTSKDFQECVDPSNRQFDGPGDSHYTYPTNQRNIAFPDKGDKTSAITFVTKDGIEMSVTGVANFRLNTSCDEITVDGKKYEGGVLQYFHELIGKRYEAYLDEGESSSSGWVKMLGIYMYRPLDTAVDRAAQQFTYQELYFDPAKKALWENAVIEQLPGLVDRQTDGEESFFTDFAITLQKPEPPKAIKEALVRKQQAIVDADAAVAKAEGDKSVAIANAATEQAKADADVAIAKAKAEAQKAVIDGFGGYQNYLYFLMAQGGLNPFQPSYGSAIVQPSNTAGK